MEPMLNSTKFTPTPKLPAPKSPQGTKKTSAKTTKAKTPVTSQPEGPEVKTVKEQRGKGSLKSNPKNSVAMSEVQKGTAEQVAGKGKKESKGESLKGIKTIQPVNQNIYGGKSVGVSAFIKHSSKVGEGDFAVESKSTKKANVALKSPSATIVKGKDLNVAVSGPSIGINDKKLDVKLGSVKVYKEHKVNDGTKVQEGTEVSLKGEAALRAAGRGAAIHKSHKIASDVIKGDAPKEVKKAAKKAAKKAIGSQTGAKATKAGQKAAKKAARETMRDIAKKEAEKQGTKLGKKGIRKAGQQVIAKSGKVLAREAGKKTAKSGAKFGLKAIAKSIPGIGNLVNAAFVVIDGVHAVKTQLNPKASAADKSVAWAHVGTDLAGVAIPWIGVAGDVGEAGYHIGKAVKAVK